MRLWIQQNRLLVLLLGAAVLLGYTHQLSGWILAHHHCAQQASSHGNHDHHHDHGHDDDHSPCPQSEDSSSGEDSTCQCDQCHLASVMIDFPDVFTSHAAVAPLLVPPTAPAPESPVPALDIPPIILSA